MSEQHSDKLDALDYLATIARAFDPVEGPVEFDATTWSHIRNHIFTLEQAERTLLPELQQLTGDTPRTDAAAILRDPPSPFNGQFVRVEFARRLERELASKTRDADHFFQLSGRYLEELNEAQAAYEILQGVKERRNPVSATPPIQAHSKTEFKRLTEQGANVLPPVSTSGERA